MTNTSRILRVFKALAVLGLLGVATEAKATFVITTNLDADDKKFFVDFANKSVLDFFGSVGVNNNNIKDVEVATNALVKTDSGYGSIKAVKDGSLTSITFTPTAGRQYDGMFFRAQIESTSHICIHNKCEDSFDGIVKAHIVDTNNNVTNLVFSDIDGDDRNFTMLGFDEKPGTAASLIKSVTLSVDTSAAFKEIKQINFSIAQPIPEPSTWAMMLLGVAGLGAVGYRAKRKAAAQTA